MGRSLDEEMPGRDHRTGEQVDEAEEIDGGHLLPLTAVPLHTAREAGRRRRGGREKADTRRGAAVSARTGRSIQCGFETFARDLKGRQQTTPSGRHLGRTASRHAPNDPSPWPDGEVLYEMGRQHLLDPFHECADAARQVVPMGHHEVHIEWFGAEVRQDLHQSSALQVPAYS